MSDELININVLIFDRVYPLKIHRNEEEKVRQAAKNINDKVIEYQKLYAGRDKQDFLAMIALTLAVDSQNKESAPNRFVSKEALHKELNLIHEALLQAVQS